MLNKLENQTHENNANCHQDWVDKVFEFLEIQNFTHRY